MTGHPYTAHPLKLFKSNETKKRGKRRWKAMRMSKRKKEKEKEEMLCKGCGGAIELLTCILKTKRMEY